MVTPNVPPLPTSTGGSGSGTTGTGTFTPTGLQNSTRYGTFVTYNNADVRGGVGPAESLWSSATTSANQNPPFLGMASGQLMEQLDTGGVGSRPARLLRGFIRRTYSDTNDPNSGSRLNFMFNPPEIHRDYVSYLDQGALDPFNTIYQSGNLVAPPSILNFSFDLFFDRQEEAMDPHNPGTFVDQEFFDKVVRGVRNDQVGTNPSGIPDNGLILSGAQDITVVFSPQMAVSGRPINASISYLKFTHRMIPTRMVISLQIRAVRIGPVTQQVSALSSFASGSAAESFAAASRVPVAAQADTVVKFTRSDLEFVATAEEFKSFAVAIAAVQNLVNAANSIATIVNGSGPGDGSAVDYAKAHSANTKYTATNRMDLWNHADCSSLVWGGHAGAGTAAALGWPAWNGTGNPPDAPSSFYMWDGLKNSTAAQKIWGFSGTPGRTEGLRLMQKGDLLFRIVGDGSVVGENHVSFVEAVSGDTITTYAAKGSNATPNCGSTTFTVNNVPSRYNYGIRPLVRAGTTSVTANNPHPNETPHTSNSFWDNLFL